MTDSRDEFTKLYGEPTTYTLIASIPIMQLSGSQSLARLPERYIEIENQTDLRWPREHLVDFTQGYGEPVTYSRLSRLGRFPLPVMYRSGSQKPEFVNDFETPSQEI